MASSVLVFGNNDKPQVKIADFEFSHELNDADHFIDTSMDISMLKWLAPESFNNGYFDIQSDV